LARVVPLYRTGNAINIKSHCLAVAAFSDLLSPRRAFDMPLDFRPLVFRLFSDVGQAQLPYGQLPMGKRLICYIPALDRVASLTPQSTAGMFIIRLECLH